MSFTVELDEKMQEQAFAVIAKYGLTPTELIKNFFAQIISSKSLNFEYQEESNPCPLCAGREYKPEFVQSLLAARAEFGKGEEFLTVEEAIAAMEKIANG